MKTEIKESIKNKIESTDWSKFNGPDLYDAEGVSSTLIGLLEIIGPEGIKKKGFQVINALGNNHQGVYYPAVLEALDYIILIEQNTNNESCRTCAQDILNNLHYFEPDLGGYEGCSKEELKEFVREKTKPYSDDEPVELL